MKITTLIILAAALFFGCNRKEKQLSLKNQELTGVIEQRDSLIKELGNTLDEIEKNLGVISTSDDDQGDLKERMRRDISHINSLIDQNQSRYDSLRRVIGWGQSRYSKLTGRMDTMNNELAQRNSRIDELNTQINSYTNRVSSQEEAIDNLRNTSSEQASKIEQMTRQLNTGYVVIGKEKELLENEIIYKDGGFLGILGRTDRFNPTFKNDLFKRIDILENNMIEVKKEKSNEKINIVTVHPPESYTLRDIDEDMAQVEITDPERFWEASKYLVVMRD